MTEIKLPQPPRASESTFDSWMFRLWKAVSDLGATSDSGTTSHASLSNLNTSAYSHLTATQKDDLTDGGDSSLHYHSEDRDRANHTGTQTADTISDLYAVVSSISGSGAASESGSILSTQVFGS